MQNILVILLLVAIPLAANAARVGDKNLGWPGTTLSGTECYGGGQGYGPYDYTDPRSRQGGGNAPLNIVERGHFTPEVENLIRGKTTTTPVGDLNYTLKAFPNHHRALWSMSRYYLQQGRSLGYEKMLNDERAHRGITPPECYFQRAMAFAPEDPMVPAVFGIYLHRRGKHEAAMESYVKAEEQLPNHPELLYNIGLLQFDLGNNEKAKEYAERAQALGYPLTGLQKKILRRDSEPQQNHRENMPAQ